MSALSFGIWSRVAWAAVLLAFALTSGSARAGCGDHVLILPAADGEQPVPTKSPCHGPGCHSSPADSPLPAAGTVVPDSRVKPSLLTVADTATTAGDFASHLAPVSDGRPVRRSKPVFHPPRVG